MNDAIAQFSSYQTALHTTGRALPRLLVDLDRLDHNIDLLAKQLPTELALRLVVKSLPSLGLLEYLQQRLGVKRLMFFHQPFLTELAHTQDATLDFLLGKPMPTATAAYFYRRFPTSGGIDPFRQVQWLVDSKERLQQYLELAKALDCGNSTPPLRLNLEVDVGLRRGGFADSASLREGLKLIESAGGALVFSGLMGYDPHVVKLPSIFGSIAQFHKQATSTYREYQAVIRQAFPNYWRSDLTFNGAGSPTFSLHCRGNSPLNEVAVGSALLKPSTFDTPSLVDYQAACFLATPVLKIFPRTRLPGLNWLSLPHPSCFIYGGYWKADYCFPEGIKENKLFGPSTNQSLLNLPRGSTLKVDDYIFLRPQQSEFVLLQFGDLLAIRKGKVIAEWPVLSN
ncbi:MAG: alanine racemase [Bacteroidota bacterium]